MALIPATGTGRGVNETGEPSIKDASTIEVLQQGAMNRSVNFCNYSDRQRNFTTEGTKTQRNRGAELARNSPPAPRKSGGLFSSLRVSVISAVRH